MFDTKKFGGFLALLRKRADMTQSEVADRLNVTRQAVSKWETGDSFPDISILTAVAVTFGVSLDTLIAAGDPSAGESKVLTNLAKGLESEAERMEDVMNLAPYLRPSELEKISAKLRPQGVDISDITEFSRWLNDDAAADLIRRASFDTLEGEEEMEFLAHLMPLLHAKSRLALFTRVVDGSLDWHILKLLAPYTLDLHSLVEAAYVDGVVPHEALQWYNDAQADAIERMIQERNEP